MQNPNEKSMHNVQTNPVIYSINSWISTDSIEFHDHVELKQRPQFKIQLLVLFLFYDRRLPSFNFAAISRPTSSRIDRTTLKVAFDTLNRVSTAPRRGTNLNNVYRKLVWNKLRRAHKHN